MSQQTTWFAHELQQEVAKKKELTRVVQRFEAEKEKVNERANHLEEKHHLQEELIDDVETGLLLLGSRPGRPKRRFACWKKNFV